MIYVICINSPQVGILRVIGDVRAEIALAKHDLHECPQLCKNCPKIKIFRKTDFIISSFKGETHASKDPSFCSDTKAAGRGI